MLQGQTGTTSAGDQSQADSPYETQRSHADSKLTILMGRIRIVSNVILETPGLSDRVSIVLPQRVDERLPAATRRATLASANTATAKKMRLPVFFMWSLLPKNRQYGEELTSMAPNHDQCRGDLPVPNGSLRHQPLPEIVLLRTTNRRPRQLPISSDFTSSSRHRRCEQ